MPAHSSATLPEIPLAHLAEAEVLTEEPWLLIYSTVLETEVLLYKKNATERPPKEVTEGRVAYRDDECAVLLAVKPSPEVLRRIHEAKAAFPRSVLQQPEAGKRAVDLFKGGARVAMVEG